MLGEYLEIFCFSAFLLFPPGHLALAAKWHRAPFLCQCPWMCPAHEEPLRMNLGAEARWAPHLQRVPVGSVAGQGSQEGQHSHRVCAHGVKGSGGCWASLARGFLLMCNCCLNRAASAKARKNPERKSCSCTGCAGSSPCVCVPRELPRQFQLWSRVHELCLPAVHTPVPGWSPQLFTGAWLEAGLLHTERSFMAVSRHCWILLQLVLGRKTHFHPTCTSEQLIVWGVILG